MANELAVGYISIIPTTDKIAPGIRKSLSGMGNVGLKTGESLGSRISSGIAKTLKVGAATAGVAAGAVLATSITKGLGRLSGIENAQAKLAGLGHEAEGVAGIMDDALASVKGTSYGLEDAATIAASAVAAGVKPGQDLERTLKMTGDAASIAGTDLGSMGSIINKVITADMAQMDSMNQLMDAGIPILQMVADEMGVTAVEARKMASDGEISFEIFQSALEKGVGGAALKAGETVQGSFANMGAAAGRFGATLMDPAFTAAPAIFTALGGAFDEVNTAIGPSADRIGEVLAPALENVAELIETRVGPMLGEGAEKLGELAVALTEKVVDPATWERVGDVFGSIKETVEDLWPSLQSLADSFFTISQNISVAVWDSLAATLNALAPVIESVLVPLVERVADFAEQNPGAVQAMVVAFLGFKGLSAVAGPVTTFAKGMKTAGGALSFVSNAFKGTNFAGGLVNIMAGFKSANPVIAMLGRGVATFTKVLATASKFLGPVVKFLATAIRFVNPWVAGITLVAGALTWFFMKTETGQNIWEKFTNSIGVGVDWVVEKFQAFTGWISDAWDGITNLFKGDYTGDLSSAFGIEEDSPIIRFFFTVRDLISDTRDYITGVWDILFKGDYTGLPFGLGEDSALVDFFFNIREAAIRAGEIITSVWNGIVTVGKYAVAIIATIVIAPMLLAWNTLSAAFSWGWESVIKPVWEMLQAGALSMWENVLMPVFTWIGEKWQQLGVLIGVGWAAINYYWELMKFTAHALYHEHIAPIFTWIGEKWDFLVAVIGLGWNMIKYYWELLQVTLQNLYYQYIAPIFAWIGDRWNDLSNAIKAAWETVIKVTWDALSAALSWMYENIIRPTLQWISDRWGDMVNALETGWHWIRDNVFAPLGSGLETVKGWFESAVEGIGNAWDKLREKTAGPVNFVIEWIFNKGIMPAWNAVAGLVNLPTLSEVPMIGGYARGGVLPGFTPGRDVHDFYSPSGGRIALSGGEAIMRPEWTRQVGGPAAVERMNADARAGRLPVERHGSGSAAFARGGVFDLGAFAGGGVIGAMMNIVRQKYPQLTMTSGLRPGQGGMHGQGLATDWSNGSGNTPAQLSLAHDIARTYPGSAELIYDSPGWSGNIKGGQNVGAFGGFYNMAQAGAHHHHVHWGMTTPPTMPFGGGVFEGGSDGGGGGGIWQSITGMVKSLWDNIIDKIPSYDGDTGGSFGDLPGAFLKRSAGAAWDFIKSKADKIMQLVGGGNSGSVDLAGISGPVVDQVEQVFAKHGFTGAEWEAAKWIVQKESNWVPTATNPSSGAFGLFQFNPMGGDTLGTYLPSRSTDPAVQGDAGARYIKDRYGTPTAAKAFWEQNQWYDEGGYLQPGTTVVQNDSGKPEPVFNAAQWNSINRMINLMPFMGESMQVVAKEMGMAFAGSDAGYKELAKVLGNAKWAKAIVNGAATLGVISRDTDFIAANEELRKTAEEAGRGYLETQASSALDIVGLGGLVPLGIKAGEAAWDMYQASPVEVGVNGQNIVVEIDAEGGDWVHIDRFQELAERVQGIDVKVNRRPPAASVTRGGAM